jgi:hypothetical protein
MTTMGPQLAALGLVRQLPALAKLDVIYPLATTTPWSGRPSSRPP